MGLRKIFLGAAVAVVLTGCVSASKYDELEANHNETAKALKDAREQIAEMTIVITDLQNRLGSTTMDKSNLQSSIEEMKLAMKEMEERRTMAEKRMKEYEELLRKFQKLIDTGKLSVTIIDGRMVVSLGSDILFPSGSAQLSPIGQENIREIGKVLRTLGDRKYQIEGHTDNVPIKTAAFPSNWELASARALTVVKGLIEAGMKKENLSAASFADIKPVRENTTAEGRQYNRRIEIVVVPDLSDLPGFDELNKMNQANVDAAPAPREAKNDAKTEAPPKIQVEGL
jgi:chemotaxis protein MotB